MYKSIRLIITCKIINSDNIWYNDNKYERGIHQWRMSYILKPWTSSIKMHGGEKLFIYFKKRSVVLKICGIDCWKLRSMWNQAISILFPRGLTKIHIMPLSCCGITLLSCLYKVYTGVLNNIIVGYMDDFDIDNNEQNTLLERALMYGPSIWFEISYYRHKFG